MTRTEMIVTLYRDRELQLWGIPYAMRRSVGQEPRHLQQAGPNGWVPAGWYWLGSPGWWGSKPKEEIAEVETFLGGLKGVIPENPHEWVELEGRACGSVQPTLGAGRRLCQLYKHHDGDHASAGSRWPQVIL